LGVATHLALDIGGELFSGSSPDQSIWLAIFWPWSGRFPVAQFQTALEHLRLTLQSAYVVAGEIVGAALLFWSWRKKRQSA
jgi:hypothetical protein